MRGGARVGSGPKGPRKMILVPRTADVEGVLENKTPLEYMLDVMNDTSVDVLRRDRMAMAAAPFVHVRADAAQEGKKEQRQANAEVSSSVGRFAVPDSPKWVKH